MDTAAELAAWVERRDEDAFTGLVRRHAGMVVNACRRQLGPGQVADEAAQAVFIILGRRAGVVRDAGHLGAWLYGVTQGVCRNARRAAERRVRHEQEAARKAGRMPPPSGNAEPAWEDLRPHLDAALAALSAAQREAVVGQFLLDQPPAKLATSLGISEEALRKRIAYALEKLRSWFTRRGIPVGAVALASGLASEASAVEAPVLSACVQAGLHPATATGAAALAGTGTGITSLAVALLALGSLTFGGIMAWQAHGQVPAPIVAIPAATTATGPALQRLLATTITATYQRDHLSEVLVDLYVRTGLDAGYPPSIARSFTFSLQDKSITVGAVLEALAKEGGLTLGYLDDRVVFWKPVDDATLTTLGATLRAGSVEERIAAAFDLAQLADPRIYPPLCAAIADPDEMVSLSVLRYLRDDYSGFGHPLAYQSLAQVPIDLLLSRLREQPYRVASEAAWVLGNSRDPRALDPLIALLKDADPQVRVHASSALYYLRDLRAQEPLIALLEDGDERVRNMVLVGMDKWRDLRPTSPILTLLRDSGKRPETQRQIISFVGKWRNPHAVEPLISLLAVPGLRTAVIQSLGQTDEPKAVDQLIALLSDPDPEIRETAVDSLGYLHSVRDPRAVEPLIALIDDANQSVRCATISALAKIGDPRGLDPLLGLLSNPSSKIRQAAMWGLSSWHEARAVDRLLEMIHDSDSGLAYTAQENLARLRDPRAFDPLVDMVARNSLAIHIYYVAELRDPRMFSALVALLQDPKPDVRRNAAVGLGYLADPRKPEALQPLLADADGGVRRQAAKAIGFAVNRTWSEQLRELLKHPDAEVHHGAVDALLLCPDPRALGPQIAVLKSAEFTESMFDNVNSRLGGFGDPRICTALLALLKDVDPAIRKNATLGLKHLRDARALEPLVSLFTSDADHGVRDAAGEALGSLDDPRALDRLAALLQTDDPQLRAAVLNALQFGHDSRTTDVIATMLTDPHRQIRGFAACVLANRNDARAVDPLLTQLGDADPEMRASAAAGLRRFLPDAKIEAALTAAAQVAGDQQPASSGNNPDPAPAKNDF